jgi:16S rRNA (cytosine967-C5)-methyltransferase
VIAPARIAAYQILIDIASARSDLPTAIARARSSLEDDRDRALAADIATGVQRWRGTLDYLIVAFANRPLDRIDPEVREILRLSAYQLLHLTRVPASAVVDDAVDLARKAGKRSATGFVNAVLRGLSRRRHSLPLPPRPSDPSDRTAALDYLVAGLSHPRWLAARWYDRLGFEAAERWMQYNNAPAPLMLRANRVRMTRDELARRLSERQVTTRPGRYAPDALRVEDGQPLRDPGAEAGWFVVQDESSQLVALLAGDGPRRRVLDTCAAPGGKATAIAPGAGRVVACDVRGRRVDLLRRTVQATGVTNIEIAQVDVLRPLPFNDVFDCVLVDAPCSGLGTLRRDPDIRWRRQASDLPALAAAQAIMLRHAAAAVAPGGRLVYATCSSEPEENDDVVGTFLMQAPAFTRIDARLAHALLPADVVDDQGYLRTEPHRHQLEAFFGAVFTRRA